MISAQVYLASHGYPEWYINPLIIHSIPLIPDRGEWDGIRGYSRIRIVLEVFAMLQFFAIVLQNCLLCGKDSRAVEREEDVKGTMSRFVNMFRREGGGRRRAEEGRNERRKASERSGKRARDLGNLGSFSDFWPWRTFGEGGVEYGVICLVTPGWLGIGRVCLFCLKISIYEDQGKLILYNNPCAKYTSFSFY